MESLSYHSFFMWVASGGAAYVEDIVAWTQAAMVQNTWYTVMDTKTNIRWCGCLFYIDTTNETIEMKTTINGTSVTASRALTKDSNQYWLLYSVGTGVYWALPNSDYASLKLEIRKTTAAGVCNSYVKYQYSQF